MGVNPSWLDLVRLSTETASHEVSASNCSAYHLYSMLNSIAIGSLVSRFNSQKGVHDQIL